MIELLTIILLSLWCHGWHHLFQPGEALYFLSRWAYEDYEYAKTQKERGIKKINQWYSDSLVNTPHDQLDSLQDIYNEKLEDNTREFERKIYLLKPLFLCPICFASIYGTGGYLLLNYTTWGIFPVSIIALISVNKLMQRFLN